MRNYFNAIIEYHDSPETQVEIIIKVGDVDSVDDMYVDTYVSHQSEIKTIKEKGHPDFKLIEYWKEPRPTVDEPRKPVLEPARTMIKYDYLDWMIDNE